MATAAIATITHGSGKRRIPRSSTSSKPKNAYTTAVLRPTEAFQEQLYQKCCRAFNKPTLLSHSNVRVAIPISQKTVEGLQYPVHYRPPR